MSRLMQDGTAEHVSRDKILRSVRGQGNIIFSCPADHVQDWQPYPVDPYSCCMCDHASRVALLSPPVSLANEGPRIQEKCVGKTLDKQRIRP